MLEQLPDGLMRPVRRRYRSGMRHVPRPVRRIVGWARSDESLLTAAALSFYALMSFPPMVLIAFWIVGAVAGKDQLQSAGDTLSGWLPQQLQSTGLLTTMTSVAAGVGWTSVLAAVWPATWYGGGLSRAFDRIAGGDKRRLDGLRGRALGLTLVLALPLGVLAVLLVAFLAPGITGKGVWAYVLGLVAGGLLGLVLLTGVLAAVYKAFGAVDAGWRQTTAGGALAALAAVLVSAGFVGYVRLAGSYDTKYGNHLVGTVALFALWVYLVHLVVLSGYRWTTNRARRRRGSSTSSSDPEGAGRAGSAAARQTSSSEPTSQNWL
ncbi:MAG: YihY/virulence factor BrkB family protein [Motilibacteraceae bacterium]